MLQDEKTRMRIYKLAFATVYPLYIRKAERKGRHKAEVDSIIRWLTGYSQEQIEDHLTKASDFETFFTQAPAFTPLATKITGLICGVRVEEIEDPIVQKVRYLDKLIDELAKGRAMDKILRS